MIPPMRAALRLVAFLAFALSAMLPADAARPIRMTSSTSGQSFSIAKGVPQMIETTATFSEIVVGDPALADAILDRLIHSSHKLELKGDSMRKRKSASAK